MIDFFVTLCARVLWLCILLFIGTLGTVSPAIAQSSKQSDIAQLRMSLAQRSLWGRNYPALIASIPGWARIQEKTIVVAPDVVFGGTPFQSREEAEAQAKRLAAALSEQPPTLAPDFERAASEGRKALVGKIVARPYGGNSYRVALGVGFNFLPDLMIAEVQRSLGKESEIRQEIDDSGDRRPIVYTGHVYGHGAEIFQLSSYAPASDQVVRVILEVSSALEAIGGAP